MDLSLSRATHSVELVLPLFSTRTKRQSVTRRILQESMTRWGRCATPVINSMISLPSSPCTHKVQLSYMFVISAFITLRGKKPLSLLWMFWLPDGRRYCDGSIFNELVTKEVICSGIATRVTLYLHWRFWSCYLGKFWLLHRATRWKCVHFSVFTCKCSRPFVLTLSKHMQFQTFIVQT